jgi:hypothetical protein
MNKIIFLAVLSFIVFPISIFAGGKCEVTLVNRTGAPISQVIVKEAENGAVKTFNMAIEKNSSSVLKLKKGIVCDITLFDNKGHKYGRTSCKLGNDSERIEIKNTDFMPHGAGDVIKKLLFL